MKKHSSYLTVHNTASFFATATTQMIGSFIRHIINSGTMVYVCTVLAEMRLTVRNVIPLENNY